MDDLTARNATREMLKILGESQLMRSFAKSSAIHKIKCQPFFGKPILPKSDSGFVTFRRPAPYVKK